MKLEKGELFRIENPDFSYLLNPKYVPTEFDIYHKDGRRYYYKSKEVPKNIYMKMWNSFLKKHPIETWTI